MPTRDHLSNVMLMTNQTCQRKDFSILTRAMIQIKAGQLISQKRSWMCWKQLWNNTAIISMQRLPEVTYKRSLNYLIMQLTIPNNYCLRHKSSLCTITFTTFVSGISRIKTISTSRHHHSLFLSKICLELDSHSSLKLSTTSHVYTIIEMMQSWSLIQQELLQTS